MQTKANMTDRELLEAAAKAAGYMLGRHSQDDCKLTFGGKEWNPLTDDGDALQLALKLKISLHHFSDSCAAANRARFCSEPYGSGPAAAVRRAIVRAAAD